MCQTDQVETALLKPAVGEKPTTRLRASKGMEVVQGHRAVEACESLGDAGYMKLEARQIATSAARYELGIDNLYTTTEKWNQELFQVNSSRIESVGTAHARAH
jgi:hypothetical protein